MFLKKALPFVLAILLLGGVFFSGIYVGEQRAGEVMLPEGLENINQGAQNDVDFAPFWRVWNEISERHVSPEGLETETQERVWGAIQGLAGSLGDPYTTFLPPVEAEQFAEDIRGTFSGVGMEIGIRDNVLTVIAPLKGTPAERAGIRAGDIVIGIDGEPSAELSIDEAVTRIRGEEGTTVKLTILREGRGEPLEIDVVRANIQVPTIDTTLRPDGIFVIELYNFNATASDSFRKALREFVESGTDKLILDLRGNPGGFLSAAIDISSWFLAPGEVVVREEFGEKTERESEIHRSRGYDVFNENLKMAILVNGGSASASEIVAGALRDHDIATLVGEQTFGKGSVQELVDITNDTQLKLTIALWLTPDGVSISGGGLEPDIVVEPTPEDIEAGRDPQLDAAVEYLLSI